MKRLFVVIIPIGLLLAISLASCEDEQKPEELIIGKWNQVTVITTHYENDVQTDVWTFTFESNEVVREYKEGGTGTIYNYGTVLDTFTWQIDGDILITNSSEYQFTISKTHLTTKWTNEATVQGVVLKEVWEYFYTRV